MSMTMTDEPLSDEAEHARYVVKLGAIVDLEELVNGPKTGEMPVHIPDAALFVHQAFRQYRSGMDDNDPYLPRVARIEHDFIAALGALNFDDQKKQLRKALKAIQFLVPSTSNAKELIRSRVGA